MPPPRHGPYQDLDPVNEYFGGAESREPFYVDMDRRDLDPRELLYLDDVGINELDSHDRYCSTEASRDSYHRSKDGRYVYHRSKDDCDPYHRSKKDCDSYHRSMNDSVPYQRLKDDRDPYHGSKDRDSYHGSKDDCGSYHRFKDELDPYHRAKDELDPYHRSKDELDPYHRSKDELDLYHRSKDELDPYRRSKDELDPYRRSKDELDPYRRSKDELDPYRRSKDELDPYRRSKDELDPYRRSKNELDPYRRFKDDSDPYHRSKDELDPYCRFKDDEDPHYRSTNSRTPYTRSFDHQAETDEYGHSRHGRQGKVKSSGPIPEELLNMFGKKKCELCICLLPNKSQADVHYAGKQHLKRVKRYFEMWRERERKEIPTSWLSIISNHKSVDLSLPNNVSAEKCKVCNIKFPFPYVARQHYEGKEHEEAVEIYLKKHPGANVVTKASLNVPPLKYECDICNVKVTSRSQLETHLNGSKHRKTVNRLEQEKVEEMEMMELMGIDWEEEEDEGFSGRSSQHDVISSSDGVTNVQNVNGDNDDHITDLLCRLCKIKLATEEEVGLHITSQDHLNKVKLHNKQNTLSVEDHVDDDIKCDLCKMKFPSQSAYDSHLEWKSHINKMAVMTESTRKHNTCELCRMDFFSNQSYEAHFSTPLHIGNEKWAKEWQKKQVIFVLPAQGKKDQRCEENKETVHSAEVMQKNDAIKLVDSDSAKNIEMVEQSLCSKNKSESIQMHVNTNHQSKNKIVKSQASPKHSEECKSSQMDVDPSLKSKTRVLRSQAPPKGSKESEPSKIDIDTNVESKNKIVKSQASPKHSEGCDVGSKNKDAKSQAPPKHSEECKSSQMDVDTSVESKTTVLRSQASPKYLEECESSKMDVDTSLESENNITKSQASPKHSKECEPSKISVDTNLGSKNKIVKLQASPKHSEECDVGSKNEILKSQASPKHSEECESSQMDVDTSLESKNRFVKSQASPKHSKESEPSKMDFDTNVECKNKIVKSQASPKLSKECYVRIVKLELSPKHLKEINSSVCTKVEKQNVQSRTELRLKESKESSQPTSEMNMLQEDEKDETKDERATYSCKMCGISVVSLMSYEHHIGSTQHILRLSLQLPGGMCDNTNEPTSNQQKPAFTVAECSKNQQKPAFTVAESSKNSFTVADSIKYSLSVAESSKDSKCYYCKICNVYSEACHIKSHKHKLAVVNSILAQKKPTDSEFSGNVKKGKRGAKSCSKPEKLNISSNTHIHKSSGNMNEGYLKYMTQLFDSPVDIYKSNVKTVVNPTFSGNMKKGILKNNVESFGKPEKLVISSDVGIHRSNEKTVVNCSQAGKVDKQSKFKHKQPLPLVSVKESDKAEDSTVFECKLCGIVVVGSVPYEVHVGSMQHTLKLALQSTPAENVEPSKQQESTVVENFKKTMETFHCEMCNYSFLSSSQLDSHLKSNKHKSVVAALEICRKKFQQKPVQATPGNMKIGILKKSTEIIDKSENLNTSSFTGNTSTNSIYQSDDIKGKKPRNDESPNKELQNTTILRPADKTFTEISHNTTFSGRIGRTLAEISRSLQKKENTEVSHSKKIIVNSSQNVEIFNRIKIDFPRFYTTKFGTAAGNTHLQMPSNTEMAAHCTNNNVPEMYRFPIPYATGVSTAVGNAHLQMPSKNNVPERLRFSAPYATEVSTAVGNTHLQKPSNTEMAHCRINNVPESLSFSAPYATEVSTAVGNTHLHKPSNTEMAHCTINNVPKRLSFSAPYATEVSTAVGNTHLQKPSNTEMAHCTGNNIPKSLHNIPKVIHNKETTDIMKRALQKLQTVKILPQKFEDTTVTDAIKKALERFQSTETSGLNERTHPRRSPNNELSHIIYNAYPEKQNTEITHVEKTLPEIFRNTAERSQSTSERCRYTPERHPYSSERHLASPERCRVSPKRCRDSPERHRGRPERYKHSKSSYDVKMTLRESHENTIMSHTVETVLSEKCHRSEVLRILEETLPYSQSKEISYGTGRDIPARYESITLSNDPLKITLFKTLQTTAMSDQMRKSLIEKLKSTEISQLMQSACSESPQKTETSEIKESITFEHQKTAVSDLFGNMSCKALRDSELPHFRSFACKVCQVNYYSSSELREHTDSQGHIANVELLRRFIARFKSLAVYDVEDDELIESQSYRCFKCGFSSSVVREFNQHILETHWRSVLLMRKRKYGEFLQDSSKPSTSKSIIEDGEIQRKAPIPVKRARKHYECSLCKKSFSFEEDYEDHLESETHKERLMLVSDLTDYSFDVSLSDQNSSTQIHGFQDSELVNTVSLSGENQKGKGANANRKSGQVVHCWSSKGQAALLPGASRISPPIQTFRNQNIAVTAIPANVLSQKYY